MDVNNIHYEFMTTLKIHRKHYILNTEDIKNYIGMDR